MVDKVLYYINYPIIVGGLFLIIMGIIKGYGAAVFVGIVISVYSIISIVRYKSKHKKPNQDKEK